jgi:histidinol dehydrogenase
MKIITEKQASKILQRNYIQDNLVQERVAEILKKVKLKKNKAIFEYTSLFDKTKLNSSNIQVSKKEIQQAYKLVSKKELNAIKFALKNISKFQKEILPKKWIKDFGNGVKLGQLVNPLDSVGCYVPAGSFPLPSSALMNIVPAKIAGVKEIIVCTPAKNNLLNPYLIVACDLAGATKIFKIGGAQAIAAMAFGTESIPKVNKITGPGNAYVTEAKKQVFGETGIDMLAGPTEVMIIARKGNPAFIAADLLAQAEHDFNAKAILLTDSINLAKEVRSEVKKQLKKLKTKKIALKALKNSAIIQVKSINNAFRIANAFAPEHLELIGLEKKYLSKVRNAGAVFFGEFSCESLGDYCSGINHILPTGCYAKVRAGLSVLDFVKTPSIQIVSKKGLNYLSNSAETLAGIEGLEAHKKAVEVRK